MGSGFDIIPFLPFVVIIGIFYVLIIRPQQQKLKAHQAVLANLRRGDRVITNGGLIATVSKIVSDTEVQLEIAEDIRVRHARSMIAQVLAKTDPVPSGDTPQESITASSVVKKADASKAKKPRKPANRSTGKTKV